MFRRKLYKFYLCTLYISSIIIFLLNTSQYEVEFNPYNPLQTQNRTSDSIAEKTNIYNDTNVRLIENEYCNGTEACRFYRKNNTWHPTKVRILSYTWNLCKNNHGADLDLFGYAWTRHASFETRQAIRRTWANRAVFTTLNVGFVLGVSSDERLNAIIANESRKYGDIIQGDFSDTYRNLTFKLLTVWRWIKYNCRNAKHFIKIDGMI
jgi:hypothetical protein